MNGENMHPQRLCHAYLLRLWQEAPQTPWRALTRDVESGEERHFATLDQLFLFLYQHTVRREGREPPGGRHAPEGREEETS
jgi:hypothetical protein